MAGPFIIEALGSSHDRESFSCGVEALDRYFQKQVTQDVRRRATACDVAIDSAGANVAGYYTLAAAGIPLADMPAELAKRLPRYPSVPVARLGHLAVDQELISPRAPSHVAAIATESHAQFGKLAASIDGGGSRVVSSSR
jgi:hypothetical protein